MQLKKELSLMDVFSISAGTMISSGIFILPGLAFGKVGPALFISYFLAGLLALTGALSIAELSSAMPKAGGDYFFITRSLGPLVGTISGFLSWLAISLKTSFAIIGISELLTIFFNVPIVYTSIIVSLFFILINIVGVKLAGRFEVFIVIALLIIMGLFSIFGISKVSLEKFYSFTPHGVNAIFLTAGYVFVSYGGLLKIASISEEVKNPKKNLPLGILLSLIFVIILYSFMVFIVIGTSDHSTLAGSLTPIADSARNIFGKPGYFVLLLAGFLAFVSTGNAGIMAASRYPFALSRDKLLPEFLSYINKKTKTPILSILITGVIIIFSFFLQLDELVKVASSVIILSYILSNLSVIILRESKIQNYKPSFRSPLYPWLQIISIILFAFLLFDMGNIVTLAISSSFILISFLLYFFYGRIRNKNTYAFLHLVARITNKKMQNSNLEDELKTILFDRDEIIMDRFDSCVSKALFLDIREKISLQQLFQKLSLNIEKIFSLSHEFAYDLLVKREEESSTAISRFLAIPHIIIEGEKKFAMIFVRSKEGIYFSEKNPDIKAVFVLIGSQDERNFHLKALSSIAQIALSKNFEKDWMEAKSLENMRDVILLGERQRF